MEKPVNVEEIIRLGIARAYVSGDPLASEGLNKNVKQPGAYIFILTKKMKVYIGSTNHLYHRRIKHLSTLRLGTHRNKNVQKVYDEDKTTGFIFSVFPTETREQAYVLEQKLLDSYAGNQRLLNISTDAINAQKGAKISEETRYKFRKAMAIRISDPSHGENISKHGIERFKNKDFKDKHSEKIKQAWQNPDTRDRMLAAIRLKSRSVSINNVVYESTGKASEILNMKPRNIATRVKSHNFPNWKYTDA